MLPTTLRWLPLAFIALAVGLAGVPPRAASAAPVVTIEVTRPGDPADAICPSANNCSLRRALELAESTPGTDPVAITFDPAAFPSASPAMIQPLASPLPATARAAITIDATGAGVVIDGSALPGLASGLILTGPDSAVIGVRIQDFGGTCLILAGERSTADRVELGGCGTGVALRGAGASLTRSLLGFAPGGVDAAPLDFGVWVDAADVVVGSSDGSTANGNSIGNASTAVLVGFGERPPFTGTVVGGNTIGRAPGGGAAPVETGISIFQPSDGTLVVGNTVAKATRAAISVAADVDGVSTTGNTIRANRFLDLGGLAIDLNANGQRDPDDAGDGDGGANGTLNHPRITRATQASVTGVACAGCKVELYEAVHMSGGADDHGSSPLPGLATADATGAFVFHNPPVSPGQWVAALATDDTGNTSEFGPSSRVGAGIIQCGNVALAAGWTFSGFFGASPVQLAGGVPGDNHAIRAIYQLQLDGTYRRWLRDTAAGRTLTVLAPGDAYWFLADTPVMLAGGFSLTSPVPVALHEGWNDLVYLGGEAPIPDALASIAGKYTDVFRYTDDGTGAGWEQYGDATLPAWARDFTTAASCTAYRIATTAAGTLTPLQP